MDSPLSVAIETSCRRGQVCLGAGDSPLESLTFQADRQHAAQLMGRLDELLRRRRLRPAELEEVYVSIGPGSYTGLRVGLTVARTLAQAIRTIRCVAVPTVQAVAANASALEFEHLGVVMDAKEQTVYLGVFARRAGRIVPAAQPNLVAVESLPGLLPKPILLIGEALEYCRLTGEGLSIGDESLWPPSAEGVWRVGREMAAAGQFTPYPQLLPLYLRKPEAVRLWEGRRSSAR